MTPEPRHCNQEHNDCQHDGETNMNALGSSPRQGTGRNEGKRQAMQEAERRETNADGVEAMRSGGCIHELGNRFMS